MKNNDDYEQDVTGTGFSKVTQGSKVFVIDVINLQETQSFSLNYPKES